MGSNMAECHPVGFQWVMEAKRRGATVIHVDPRYTRTSANASLYVPIRAGTDIAFLGGIVNYILQNGREFREYVTAYTNAATILREDFRDTEDLSGLFSGWNPEEGAYDPASWQYEGMVAKPAVGMREVTVPVGERDGHRADEPEPEQDPTLEHPRCVFQVLKRHFSRYTPEVVEQVCGVPAELFTRVAETLCQNSGRDRTTAFAYALGWTQHSVGVQNIRCAAIIQLLLGNIGRPGGGILALRGHASIQGSTDIPTLFDLLPGYLPMPHAHHHPDLDTYCRMDAPPGGYWGRMREYTVSLLRAYFGEHARPDNDWGFGLLPRIDGDHSTYPTVLGMLDGRVKGFFLLGENPAVGSANSRLHRLAMARLEWLVVRDLVEIESASFWRDAPEIASGELRTREVPTEVFFLPAAANAEKDGTFTNTQRLLQWHERAVEPRGDCRSDLWFMYHLGRRIREKLAGSTDRRDQAILALTWDYPTRGPYQDPDAEAVLAEINGYGPNGPLSTFTELKDDGTTSCGCWIYCGCFAGGVNQAARKKPGGEQSWVAPEWGWAWPANRRILYNRASADPEGRPWSERKRYVWWDAAAGRWTGHDVADIKADMAPDYRPGPGARAEMLLRGDEPFVMQADGKAWLFAPAGLRDGPLPAHYEPHESPFDNPLYEQRSNPARQRFERCENRTNRDRRRFPYVLTSYRLTEHHTAGGMSRFVPVLAELQPEMFCEVSPQLAAERQLVNGGWAVITTERSAIEARVLVTDRMKPLRVGGRIVHQVGLPWHWGNRGLARGSSANDVFPILLDPNVHIQETKAATCDIRPGRLPGRET
jgi:formate dehydrogenase major subunit